MKIAAREITPLELTHETFCEEIGECRCLSTAVSSVKKNRITGDQHIGIDDQSFPPTVTLLAGSPMDLPKAAVDLPHVQNLIHARVLRVVR